MERIMKKSFWLMLLVFVGGCTTVTPYQPMGDTGGYYHQKISENSYVIGFRGNGFTERERADDYARLYAAEVCLKLKFTHFVIEGSADKSSTQVINMGSTTSTSGNAYGYGNSMSFNGTSQTTNMAIPVHKPRVEFTVLYSEGYPEGRHLEVYAAQDVVKAMREKYRMAP